MQGVSIICPHCGHESHHPQDVAHRYCAQCKIFLGDYKLAAPGYWMNETTGVLKPAVMAYLDGLPLELAQVGALRAYFRQWVASPAWMLSPELEALRAGVDGITDRAGVDAWLNAAENLGMDPL